MTYAAKRWLLALVALTLMGVGYSYYASAQPKPAEKVGVGVQGYNFTYEAVQGFLVNDSGGPNVPPFGGGGATNCCIAIPEKWSPDLTATVEWTIGHYDLPLEKILALNGEELHKHFVRRNLKKTVPIERYESPGNIQVFFLPNDEIKVYAHDSGPQDPDHPAKTGYPRNPKEEQQETPQ